MSIEFSDHILSGLSVRSKLPSNGYCLSVFEKPAPGLPLTGCVHLHGSISLSGSQFLYLQMKTPG